MCGSNSDDPDPVLSAHPDGSKRFMKWGRGEERDKRGNLIGKRVATNCYYCERVYMSKIHHRYVGVSNGRVHYKDVRACTQRQYY